jgi:hypothetical protein
MKTEIVLSIFGGERWVTTLEDLEAAAHAIHSKSVRESETSANHSTLAAEIETQISPINGRSGPSERAAPKPPKRSLCYAQPKAGARSSTRRAGRSALDTVHCSPSRCDSPIGGSDTSFGYIVRS